MDSGSWSRRLCVCLLEVAAAASALGCACDKGMYFRGLPLIGGCEKHQCPEGTTPKISDVATDPPPENAPTMGSSPATVCACKRGEKWTGSGCVPACPEDPWFFDGTRYDRCVKNTGEETRLEPGYNELPYKNPCPWPDCGK